MAAPSYTTDLTTIDDAENNTSWVEMSWNQGGSPTSESDYYIQNSGCVSAEFKKTGLGSLAYNNGTGITISTPNVFTAWFFFGAPNALDTDANGGIRMVIGSGTGAFKGWDLGGSGSYAYGGWINIAVDPSLTADDTVGSPTSTLQYFGIGLSVTTAIFKGNPFGVDILRHGRCEARMNGGDLSNGYATFSGYAAQNDSQNNRCPGSGRQDHGNLQL